MSPGEPHSSAGEGAPSRPLRRFPAQWEPCDAVWLAWPHNLETWPGHFEGVPEAFAVFAHAIAESTPVKILASGDLAGQCREILRLTAAGRKPQQLPREIEIVDIPTNDCWIRDYGPTFVHEGDSLLAVKWHFNAWGGKYFPHDLDAAAGAQIARAAGLRLLRADLTLEGGALETDGAGRLLLHAACVLDPARNPGLTAQQCAERMHQYLGVEEILWIDGGLIPGDDTDGHIDQIARFVDRENVVVAVAENNEVPFAEALEANFRQVKLWGTETNPGVTAHRLPVPPPRTIDGHSVPQSYCNFLRLGPDRILVPTFAVPDSDDRALGILRDLCPGVDIQGIPCEKIAWGLGALHCASCHQPAVPRIG
ncbi:agmatine deiminase family protein [Aporhodopirellula aestuarii]|uniref:Agmatine deiminase family protein n=1 Tax=Aporhodopirellula aestuarii TaxID=2950107 RepID=A0ABT0U387_9BACT|nr:agmatine deiminase family protein [Aporhodopirellula aestuarii]MCM2371322.1 agmatine deiminase family protein [Aporhodopirellula aestuarii]